MVHPGFSLFARSSARTDLLVLIMKLTAVGLPLPPRSIGHVESLTPAFGLARLESLMFVSDCTSPDLLVSPHSFVQPAFATSALNMCDADSASLVRDLARMGLSVLASGLTRTGSVSVLPVVGHSHLGFLLPLQSTARCGPASPALDFLQTGFTSLLRSLSRSGPLLPLCGLTCAGFVFSPPVAGVSNLGLPMPVHSFARADTLAPAFQFSHTGSALLLRSPGYAGAAPSAPGESRPGVLPSACDFTSSDFTLLPRSHAWSGPILLTFRTMHPGSSPMLQSRG